MTRRYYHPDLPADGGWVRLLEAEAQHAVRVMRVKPGDEIELFDGNGRQAIAVIEDVSKRDCQCRAAKPAMVDREPTLALHLAIALPKQDRAREMIERLTELGVHSVTPLVAARTQRAPTAKLLEKLRRGSIEACKQSGRNVLLQINEPMEANDFFRQSAGGLRWIAHPDGTPVKQLAANIGDSLAVAIGPEGGWSDEEIACAVDSGFQGVEFGKRILRIETAATFLAARVLD